MWQKKSAEINYFCLLKRVKLASISDNNGGVFAVVVVTLAFVV